MLWFYDLLILCDKQMFLKPGSIVVEIVGQFDGRMPPLCGFHGPLASVYDIHHYVSFCLC